MGRFFVAECLTIAGLVFAAVQLARGAYVRPRPRSVDGADVAVAVMGPTLYLAGNTLLLERQWLVEALATWAAPLLPAYLYLSWLPFAFVIHRRWRRVLPATPPSQALLTVAVFAPCLGGTYGAWWLIPFFQEALGTAAMFLTGTPRPSGFLRFTVLPPLVWWTLVWLAMRRRHGLFQSRRPLAWIPARPAGR